MPTQKDHQLLGCKLFPDKDADIIGWVNSIPKGEVTEYLKGVIRWWLSGQQPPVQEKTKDDTSEMLREMHAMIRELLTRPAVVIGSTTQVQQDVIDDGLSADEINERMANMASIDFGDWG